MSLFRKAAKSIIKLTTAVNTAKEHKETNTSSSTSQTAAAPTNNRNSVTGLAALVNLRSTQSEAEDYQAILERRQKQEEESRKRKIINEKKTRDTIDQFQRVIENEFKADKIELQKVTNIGKYRIIVENTSEKEEFTVKTVRIFLDNKQIQATNAEEVIAKGAKWESSGFKAVHSDSRIKLHIFGDTGARYRVTVIQAVERVYFEGNLGLDESIVERIIPIDDNGVYRFKISKLDMLQQSQKKYIYSCWCNMSLEPEQWAYSVDDIGYSHTWTSPDIVVARRPGDEALELRLQLGAGFTIPTTTKEDIFVRKRIPHFSLSLYKVADQSMIKIEKKQEDEELCEHMIHLMNKAFASRNIPLFEQLVSEIPQDEESINIFRKAVNHAGNLKFTIQQYHQISEDIRKCIYDRDERTLEKLEKQAENLQLTDLIKKIQRAKNTVSEVIQLRADLVKLIVTHIHQFTDNYNKMSFEQEDAIFKERANMIYRIRKLQSDQNSEARKSESTMEKETGIAHVTSYLVLLEVWHEAHTILLTKYQLEEIKTLQNSIDFVMRRFKYLLEHKTYESMQEVAIPKIKQTLANLRLQRLSPELKLSIDQYEHDIKFINFVIQYRQGLSDFQESIKQERLPALVNALQNLLSKKVSESEREEAHRKTISELIIKLDITNLKLYLKQNEASIFKFEYSRCMDIISMIEAASSDFVQFLTPYEKQKMGFEAVIDIPTKNVTSTSPPTPSDNSSEGSQLESNQLAPGLENSELAQQGSRRRSSFNASSRPRSATFSTAAITAQSVASLVNIPAELKGVVSTAPMATFNFSPVAANIASSIKPIYQKDLNELNLMTNLSKVTVNIITYFKQKKMTSKLKLDVIGAENNEKMEIGHYIRKQFLPILLSIFSTGLKKKEELWSFLEEIAAAHSCMSDTKQVNSLHNFVHLINSTVSISDLKVSPKDLAHFAAAKFRILVCVAMNQKVLKQTIQDIMNTAHSNKNVLEKYYFTENCVFRTESAMKQITDALDSPSKLPMTWETNIVQNEYSPDEHETTSS